MVLMWWALIPTTQIYCTGQNFYSWKNVVFAYNWSWLTSAKKKKLQKMCKIILLHVSQVENGHIKRITDNDIHSEVLEVEGKNVRWVCASVSDYSRRVRSSLSSLLPPLYINFSICRYCSCSTTYITCPGDPRKTLGIKLPFFVMIIKGLKRYFSFEVQVGAHANHSTSTVT